ncbi:MAG: hypothetical protein ACQERM_11635 [Methanobacteriota archaeon]
MPAEKRCPDCEEPLEEMKYREPKPWGPLSIVSQESNEGFLGSLRADEILTPVPYVCPDCRRTLLYAE